MRGVVIAACILVLVAGCGRRAPDPVPAVPPARDAAAPAQPVTYPDFGDTDPHDWTWRAPRSYAIHGIDVSRWQGDIDWATARAAGVGFAYIKATEGGDVADPMFRAHWDGAGRAGVRRGAYHYFYFCRPAAEQARWFIRHVPRDATALPHVLDMEWTPHSKTCTIRPGGDKVRAEARVFLDMLETHYGRRPLIYTTVDFFAETGIERLAGTEFWLRSVAGHPRRTYPGAFWRIWQYTGTGLVAGVRGKVDINVFHDGPEAWARWAG